MRIVNGKIFVEGTFTAGSIEFDEKIRRIGSDIISEPGDVDANGCYVIPGLVDIHSHGAMGKDCSDGNPEDMDVLGRYYAAQGVTTWCPTTVTMHEAGLAAAVQAIAQYQRPSDGAKMAGIHLEGPFINPRKKGSHVRENMLPPDVALWRRLNELSQNNIRVVTLACEEPGGKELIKSLAGQCVISLGHTTADYETALQAYKLGATHTTHLFNAMPPLGHREPGVIGAAADAGATVELICDGLHVHPSVIRLAFAMFPGRVCLVSDSLRCAGMPDGRYMLGEQPVEKRGIKALVQGSDTLAGSCIHLMDGLRNCVRYGIPLEQAVLAVTAIPAGVIRRADIGALKAGNWSDLVLLGEDLQVVAVYINGKKVNVPCA